MTRHCAYSYRIQEGLVTVIVVGAIAADLRKTNERTRQRGWGTKVEIIQTEIENNEKK